MDTRRASPFVDQFRALPPGGPGRDLGLQRLVEAYAAADAASALRDAAEAGRGQDGPIADAMSAAAAAWTGSEADPVSAAQLRDAVASPAFLDAVRGWARELREIAVTRAETGACTVSTAMQLWTWTMKYFAAASTPHDAATAELAAAFCPLLAARCRILEIAAGTRVAPDGGRFAADLCHVHAARAAAATGTTCAELVFGYRRHLSWDAEGCATCYGGDELDELEGLIPGIASEARAHADVVEADGSHAAKAGPCARFDGVETFTRLRARLDGCLTGARLAKDRAAASLPQVISGTPALG
jgi:hypothetical protein